MSKYLKMSDVFNACEVVETDVKVLFAITEEYDDGVTPHEFAHHAIECHDGLLAALERLMAASRSVGNIAYNIGQSHAQWEGSIYPATREHDAAMLAALKAVAKAKAHPAA